MYIDAHQHFWHFSENKYPWMNDKMGGLKQNFLPDDLKPLLDSIDFYGSIVVQAEQNIEETHWLLELATQYPFIKGVVGWVDLCSSNVSEQLAVFSTHPAFVGVRHIIHDEADDRFMLRPDFKRGIAELQKLNLTYDLLLFPRHLPIAAKLVEEFPRQRFVIDHIAKPAIHARELLPWQDDLIKLAQFPNVFCKLSGLVTETTWSQWLPSDFYRYIDIVINLFGSHRVMIGSDWPVCTLSGNYQAVMNIVIEYIKRFPDEIQRQILGENCALFYNVK